MGENTAIEWATHTFNPWEGCTKVGPGCDHCYAESRNARFGGGTSPNWGAGAPRRRTSVSNWRQPIKWDCDTAKSGERPRVFCASLADWLDNEVPIEWLCDLLDLIRRTPNLDWLLLTKRIGNWLGRLDAASNWARQTSRVPLGSWIMSWTGGMPPANVWIGATIVNQAEADRDIPKLLKVPARVRFLSMEPLLGPVDIIRYLQIGWPAGEQTGCRAAGFACKDIDDRGSYQSVGENCYQRGWCPGIDWVIAGGESGPGARLTSPDWARSLRDQCQCAGVPFLWKQWGEWLPMLGQVEGVPVGRKATTPDGWVMGWAGKKAAGRLLDGQEHNGFPA